MNRRTFLLALTCGVGVTYMSKAGLSIFDARSFSSIAKSILMDSVPNEISEELIDDFINLATKARGDYLPLYMPMSHRLAFEWYDDPLLPNFVIPDSGHDYMRLLEEKIVTAFLLSTNYFDKANGEPVKIIHLYDPYTTACTNPFKTLVYA